MAVWHLKVVSIRIAQEPHDRFEFSARGMNASIDSRNALQTALSAKSELITAQMLQS
jgi:hypothetical protein